MGSKRNWLAQLLAHTYRFEALVQKHWCDLMTCCTNKLHTTSLFYWCCYILLRFNSKMLTYPCAIDHNVGWWKTIFMDFWMNSVASQQCFLCKNVFAKGITLCHGTIPHNNVNVRTIDRSWAMMQFCNILSPPCWNCVTCGTHQVMPRQVQGCAALVACNFVENSCIFPSCQAWKRKISWQPKIRIHTTTSLMRETIYLVPVCFIIVLPCVLVMGCLLVAHGTMVSSPFCQAVIGLFCTEAT